MNSPARRCSSPWASRQSGQASEAKPMPEGGCVCGLGTWRRSGSALAGGRWNDRQIVSKAWVDVSTSAKIKATDGQSYGYLWWLGRARLNGREVHWVGALGRGGQSIRIVSKLDLVAAVTAGYYQDYSARAFQLQYGVFRDVLRGISPPG